MKKQWRGMSIGNRPNSLFKVLRLLPSRVLPCRIADRFMLAMTQMFRYFPLQYMFNHRFGQLLDQSVLANQLFWLLVVQ
jgi:hypothetical protein